MLHPPKRTSARPPWPKRWRRRLAGQRRIVETATACEKFLPTFRLDREGPHARDGLQARLIAKMMPHNFYFWLNQCLGHLNFAVDLMNW